MEEFLNNIVQNVVANIPNLVLILSSVVYGFKAIKSFVSMFGENIKVLTQKFTILENNFKEINEGTNVNFKKITDETKSEFKEIAITFSETATGLIAEVNALKKEINYLKDENKTFKETIKSLVLKDTTMIREGASHLVVQALEGVKNGEED